MTDRVTWSAIEAECGDFREGFVAVFRKYEGQPTDELDKQGRAVKVTMRSFARHIGVAETTFRTWVRERGRRADDRDRDLRSTREERGAKAALRSPAQRKRVIESLTPDERQEVRRAIDTTDDEDFFADPEKTKAHRKTRQRTMEEGARNATMKVLWNARARAEYYGDIPLSDNETTELGYAGQVIDSLLRGEALDDGLRELLAAATEGSEDAV